MSKFCNILVGPPGVGKSTWLSNKGAFYEGPNRCIRFTPDDNSWLFYYIWSTDDIIDDIGFRYNMTYDEVFKDVIGLAEKIFWKNIELDVKSGASFYVDRTNLTRKSRKRIIDFVKNKGYTIEATVFPIPPKNEWDRRLKSRPGKTIPEEVIQSMLKSFEMPTLEEGFNSITVYEEEYENV